MEFNVDNSLRDLRVTNINVAYALMPSHWHVDLHE